MIHSFSSPKTSSSASTPTSIITASLMRPPYEAATAIPSGRLRRVSERRQVARNLGLEQADQIRIHEFELLRYVEADDALVAQVFLELGRQLGAVRPLHDDDRLRPLQ